MQQIFADGQIADSHNRTAAATANAAKNQLRAI